MHTATIYRLLCASLALLISVVSADDVDYIIFPIDGLNFEQGNELDLLIKRIAVDAEKVYASTRPKRPVPTYWGATLSEAAFSELREHRWIEDIFPNEPLVEQFADYKVQHSPPEELRVISQPPGPEPFTRYHDYVYRSDVQKQVFIYHAELGINPNHVDFTGRPVEWVYTRQAKFTGNDIETEASSSEVPGHSTCVASKAAGGIYGSSRLSTLVVVKMPDLRPTSTCEIFSTITDHILENDRLGRSIVTVSWGSKDPIRLDDIDRGGYWSHWRRVRRQIEELDAIGALLLFAAGNEAQETDRMGHLRTEVDTAPAIFAVKSTTHRVLAVSNVDSRGRLWRTSQSLTKPFADRWNVFAPGVQIKCATHDSNSKVRIDTGTSFAASLAAGLLADAIATNQIREEYGMPAIGDVMTYARGWKRIGGKSVIWNHVDRTHNPPSSILTLNPSDQTSNATVAVT